MERSRWATLTAGVALAFADASSATALAQTVDIARAAQAQENRAQTERIAQSNGQPAPSPNQSPMIKPPAPDSGSTDSGNPDNMPIRRPDKSTKDDMSRPPPASGANAK